LKGIAEGNKKHVDWICGISYFCHNNDGLLQSQKTDV